VYSYFTFCCRILCNEIVNKVKIHCADMSLVAYADSDEDASDSESSEVASPSVDGQDRVGSNEVEPVHLAGPAVVGQ